jgi:hypothetical protein
MGKLKKPDWMIQAEQDLADWQETPLGKYTDRQLEAMALAYQCPNCKEAFSAIHYPGHLKRCARMREDEQRVVDLLGQGLSMYELAEKSGLSVSRVGQIFEKFDLSPEIALKWEEEQKIILDLYARSKTFAQIAELTGHSITRISKVCNKREKKSKAWEQLMDHTQQKDKEISDAYHNGSRPTNKQISELTGHDVATVANTLKKLGLPTWSIQLTKERDEKILEAHKLGMSSKEAAAHAGINNHVTVLNVWKKHGLQSHYDRSGPRK